MRRCDKVYTSSLTRRVNYSSLDSRRLVYQSFNIQRTFFKLTFSFGSTVYFKILGWKDLAPFTVVGIHNFLHSGVGIFSGTNCILIFLVVTSYMPIKFQFLTMLTLAQQMFFFAVSRLWETKR